MIIRLPIEISVKASFIRTVTFKRLLHSSRSILRPVFMHPAYQERGPVPMRTRSDFTCLKLPLE